MVDLTLFYLSIHESCERCYDHYSRRSLLLDRLTKTQRQDGKLQLILVSQILRLHFHFLQLYHFILFLLSFKYIFLDNNHFGP